MTLRGLRVLVVEDTASVADALRYLLEEVGMVVVGPVSTVDAAERLLRDRPQLALVDMHLEGQSGHTFVNRLRDLDVPVIAISGSAELLAGSAGVARLQKPFSGRELLETVHKLVTGEMSPLSQWVTEPRRSPAVQLLVRE
jgi:DNA-binding response OmpR family regulator